MTGFRSGPLGPGIETAYSLVTLASLVNSHQEESRGSPECKVTMPLPRKGLRGD